MALFDPASNSYEDLLFVNGIANDNQRSAFLDRMANRAAQYANDRLLSTTGTSAGQRVSTAPEDIAKVVSRVAQTASGGGGGGGGGGSTSGGGGGGGGSAAAPGSGTRTGSDYLEGPGADIFARNPQAMWADMLEQIYPGNEGLGLYNMMAPYGDAMNVLFLASQGQDAAGGSKADFLNFLNDFGTNLMTPGASLGDPTVLWNNILNPAQNSPLAAYLAVQTPEDQARNFRALAAGIAGTYYHPLFADAVMDRLAYGQDAFLGESARGATDPFYDWIQGSMPYMDRLY